MYYCGVCKSIGRNFGQLSRFGLVYETAILALLLSLSSGVFNTSEVKRSTCIAHPIKKSMYINDCKCIDYAAAVNVLLLYFKLQDSWQDVKNIASLTAKIAIKRGFKKAADMFPIAADSVFFSINELTKLEKEQCNSIDKACEPFALMLSNIFKWMDSDVFSGNPLKLDLLGKIGYNVGKWIYLIDAVFDIEQDKKNKNYNVLLNINENGIIKTTSEDIKFILQLCLANCAQAYEELIKIIEKEHDTSSIRFINAKGVTDNLFYVGMRHITETKAGKLHESI